MNDPQAFARAVEIELLFWLACLFARWHVSHVSNPMIESVSITLAGIRVLHEKKRMCFRSCVSLCVSVNLVRASARDDYHHTAINLNRSARIFCGGDFHHFQITSLSYTCLKILKLVGLRLRQSRELVKYTTTIVYFAIVQFTEATISQAYTIK